MKISHQYLFLNLHLNNKLTGIERASLLRAKLFYNHLNITPTITTVRYHHKFRSLCQELIATDILHPEIPVLNMYEYFQETRTVQSKKMEYKNLNWTYKKVENTCDYRVYSEGQLIMYEKRLQTGELDYINYFANGKKVRRSKFDNNGYLSVEQIIEPTSQMVLTETFYRVDGSVCIIKHFRYENNKNVLQSIHLYNKEHQLLEVFTKENDLISYWLKEVIDESVFYYCIIDKNRMYYKQLIDHQFPNVKLIPCIHAMHTKGTDIATSDVNSNYADIFTDVDQSDAIVLLTEAQKRDVELRFGERNHYHVIPHAVEELPLKVAWTNRNRFKVVALSRYSPEKQLPDMIKIFAEVVKEIPEAILEIYGYGAEKQKLLRLISELQMTDHIYLKDYVANVADVYESAVLSLVTSRTEAFSLVTMESLAHGCPVIAYDIKYGPSDMITEGENGKLIPFQEKQEFAYAIINCIKSEEKLQKMSAKAYENIEKFTASNVSQKWARLLREC